MHPPCPARGPRYEVPLGSRAQCLPLDALRCALTPALRAVGHTAAPARATHRRRRPGRAVVRGAACGCFSVHFDACGWTLVL